MTVGPYGASTSAYMLAQQVRNCTFFAMRWKSFALAFPGGSSSRCVKHAATRLGQFADLTRWPSK